MKCNTNRMIWPYTLGLICLFALALLVPRSWQRLAVIQPALAESTSEAEARQSSPQSSGPLTVAPEPGVAIPPKTVPVKVQPEDSLEIPSVDVASPTESRPRQLYPASGDPSPERLGRIPAPSPALPLDELADGGRVEVEAASDEPIWSAPKALLSDLDAWTAGPSGGWAKRAARLIGELTAPVPVDQARATAILASLAEIEDSLEDLELRESEEARRSRIRRLRYALRRRLDIWQLLQGLAAEQLPDLDDPDARLARQVARVAVLTNSSQRGSAWQDYLMLSELRESAAAAAAEQGDKLVLARKVLARLARARNDRRSRDYLGRGAFAALDDALRRWAPAPVDARGLLAAIEHYERNGSSEAARRVTAERETLLWSAGLDHRKLAARINQHYRNANVRFMVRGELMNRWMPRHPTEESPVSDNILGAYVEGRSWTRTSLKVRLLPDPARIKIGIEARGVVSTDTASYSGPATFYSEGQTSFLARKMVALGRSGLRVLPAVADANAEQYLLDVDTSYDDVPLVRDLIQGIARQRHSESQGEARVIVQQRVADTARMRLDVQANKQFADLSLRVKDRYWRRLERLSLAPEPIELSTKSDRVVARIRIADDDQLAAHTPRPKDPPGSLAALQLHDTVVNNALRKVGLEGNTYRLPDLYGAIGAKLELPIEAPDDVPKNVKVTFAERDAVTFRFRDGRVEVRLALTSIVSGRERFRNILAQAFYVPTTDGMQLKLSRDGSIRLRGRGINLRDQIVLRGVFSKVFSKHRPMQLIDAKRVADARLAGLAVTDVVLEEGWLGFAITPARLAARSARR